MSLRVDFDNFDLNIAFFFESGRVISNNDLEGQKSKIAQEVKM